MQPNLYKNSYDISTEFLIFPFYIATLEKKHDFEHTKLVVFYKCFCTRLVFTPKKFKYFKNFCLTFGFVPANYISSYKHTNLSVNDSFFELKAKNFYFDIGTQIGGKNTTKLLTTINIYKRALIGLFVSSVKDFNTQYFLNTGLEILIYTNLLQYKKLFFDIAITQKIWYNFVMLTSNNGVLKNSLEVFLPVCNSEQENNILQSIVGTYTNLKGLSYYLTIIICFNLSRILRN